MNTIFKTVQQEKELSLSEKVANQISDLIKERNIGTGNDMKGPCIFLASHASDYLGGAIIPVDGGYLVM